MAKCFEQLTRYAPFDKLSYTSFILNSLVHSTRARPIYFWTVIMEDPVASHLIVLTARNSPVKGSCLCWITFPLTFTASPDPLVTSMSPEMARGRKP